MRTSWIVQVHSFYLLAEVQSKNTSISLKNYSKDIMEQITITLYVGQMKMGKYNVKIRR